MSIPLENVTSADWSMSLLDFGLVVQGLEDIQQAIVIILSTQKGTQPTRPEFGCDVFSFIDSPVNVAIPNMKKAIADAISAYEPRVKVTRILHSIDVSGVTFTVEFKYADGVSIITKTYGVSS